MKDRPTRGTKKRWFYTNSESGENGWHFKFWNALFFCHSKIWILFGLFPWFEVGHSWGIAEMHFLLGLQIILVFIPSCFNNQCQLFLLQVFFPHQSLPSYSTAGKALKNFLSFLLLSLFLPAPFLFPSWVWFLVLFLAECSILFFVRRPNLHWCGLCQPSIADSWGCVAVLWVADHAIFSHLSTTLDPMEPLPRLHLTRSGRLSLHSRHVGSAHVPQLHPCWHIFGADLCAPASDHKLCREYERILWVSTVLEIRWFEDLACIICKGFENIRVFL